MKLILITIGAFLFANCQTTNSQSLNQGIKGKVLWLEGNFMPGPGQNKEGEPVKRELYIYQVLNTNDVKKADMFYQPEEEPVKIVSSDEDGLFSVDLPPGTYSLLSKEKNGLFANLQDGKGNINPIVVAEGKYTEVSFKIDYKAVF